MSGKVVRVGVTGAGFQAITNHIPLSAARPGVELVAVCSFGTELAELAATYWFSRATRDAEEALRADIDAVVIATPNPLHCEIAQGLIGEIESFTCPMASPRSGCSTVLTATGPPSSQAG